MGRRNRKKNVPSPLAEEGRDLPARVVGKKLYVKAKPSMPEHVYDWNGPDGAHHATIEISSGTHVHTVRIEWKISVYDAAGTLLGEIIEEQWD